MLTERRTERIETGRTDEVLKNQVKVKNGCETASSQTFFVYVALKVAGGKGKEMELKYCFF